MVCLIELPSELLLNIASNIDGSTRQLDLCNLSLACRALRPIAQEALFREPTVALPRQVHKPTGGSYLARSLIERRDLSRLVKNLTIPFSFSSPSLPWVQMHSKPILKIGAPENLDHIAELCLETMRLQLEDKQDLIDEFGVGPRTGYVGLCLALTPYLESPNIPMYGSLKQPALEFRVDSLFVRDFGSTILKGLPAFKHLKSLLTNCPLPWSIVTLPSLTTLHFGIYQSSNTNMDFPEVCANLSIRSLTVDLGVGASTLSPLSEMKVSYLARLMYHTNQLEELSLRIKQEGPARYFRLECFDVLINHVPSHMRLKTLKIDTVDLDLQIQQRYRSLKSLRKFPSLRRVVLQQEALINFHKYTFTEMPACIQEIGVIDSTQALNIWALHICARRSELPELSKVALWCDSFSEALYYDEAFSKRVASQTSGSIDVAETRGASETMQHNEYAWNEIRRLGIVVEEHGAQERKGWR